MRDGFDYKVFFYQRTHVQKNPAFHLHLGYHIEFIQGVKKIENIHPSNYSKIMRLVYRHILNISLINRTFCYPFLQGEEGI